MIIDLTRTEAIERAGEISAVYGAAFDYSAPVVKQFTETFTRCLREYDGARVLLVRRDGAPLGFAFGFTFQRGHWWPDQVGPALESAGHAAWLHDAFELAELVVHPDHQGRGIGTALLHQVLYTTSHRRVLLATTPQNPARRLYQRSGLVELLADFRYERTGPAAIVMGADLHLAAPAPAAPRQSPGAPLAPRAPARGT